MADAVGGVGKRGSGLVRINSKIVRNEQVVAFVEKEE